MDTSKIIKGVVNSGRYTVTAPIVKEDYGLYLQIEGVELPQTYEVDFSNSENSGTSVTMIGNSDGVLIPHQFIDTGKDIFAFLYHVGEDYGRTVYKFRIPNKVRPDRTEDTPTPEEQSVIDQAISALNEAVEQTSADVASADQSAQNASEFAEDARDAEARAAARAATAQTYANNAQASATSASQSATASANSASASAQSAQSAEQTKTEVESMVEDAQASADASYQNAQTAQGYASNAQLSATQASNSARSANQSASDALTYANTASSKAQDASGYAQTASQKATESAQSASQALGYKTDAESAKTDAQTAQGKAEDAQTAAETAQGLAEDARDEAQTLADGITGKVEQIDSNTERIESLEDDRYKPYVVDSVSGSIASFPDGADDIALKSLIVNIDPVQDLSNGDPSPENICHISGWTGCEVNATNTNLCGGSKLLANAQRHIPGGIINEEEEYFQFSSGASADYDYHFSTGTPFKENTRYTFIFTIYKTSGTVTNLRVYYKDGSYSNIPNVSSAGQKETTVYTSPNGKTVNYVTKINMSGSTRIYYNESGIFEGVLTADQFEQFGKHIPISWQTEAGTVYGGKLDVLTGKLTVYPYYASYNGEALTGEWISDRDVYAVGTTPTIGAQVVNIGAEGTEIQLEPHEIASLLGQNNIFADTGDSAVEYRADTKLYIERLAAPDSADMIADSNITSGQYFMVGNSLFKATANIANGGQIVVGTNCTRVSLAQALNEINA